MAPYRPFSFGSSLPASMYLRNSSTHHFFGWSYGSRFGGGGGFSGGGGGSYSGNGDYGGGSGTDEDPYRIGKVVCRPARFEELTGNMWQILSLYTKVSLLPNIADLIDAKGQGLGGGSYNKEDPKKKEEDKKKPCLNQEGTKANPLVKMKVLGTLKNGIPGGRYGYGRGKFHDGTDLDAPVGTTVYAMFEGTVGMVVTSHIQGEIWTRDFQEQLKTKGKDDNGAGNRIYVGSKVGNDRIQIGYWHLSNVADGIKSGTKVTQGQLIGYSGSTGNASGSDSAGPHLHIRGRKNGKKYDPEGFFYSTFNKKGETTNPCN